MVATAAGNAPLLPASPAAVAEPPRARSAPGLSLSHFRLAPRNSTRLARGPKGSWGAARWRRQLGEVGEKVEERHLLLAPFLLRRRPIRFRDWLVSSAEPLIAHTLKMEQEGQQKSLA